MSLTVCLCKTRFHDCPIHRTLPAYSCDKHNLSHHDGCWECDPDLDPELIYLRAVLKKDSEENKAFKAAFKSHEDRITRLEQIILNLTGSPSAGASDSSGVIVEGDPNCQHDLMAAGRMGMKSIVKCTKCGRKTLR